MNNSKKQAAAFEPKWTCEKPETRRTLTAPLILTSQTHSAGSIFHTSSVSACLLMNHFLNERVIEASQSRPVSFTFLFCQMQTENQTNWDGRPGSAPHLFPTPSLPLTAQSSNLIPIFSAARLSPPLPCFHPALTPSPPLFSVCYWTSVRTLCPWILALPVGLPANAHWPVLHTIWRNTLWLDWWISVLYQSLCSHD